MINRAIVLYGKNDKHDIKQFNADEWSENSEAIMKIKPCEVVVFYENGEHKIIKQHEKSTEKINLIDRIRLFIWMFFDTLKDGFKELPLAIKYNRIKWQQ